MLSVLTLYLDWLNTATYVQPPTVRALIADPSNVNTLKSTRPSGVFFFFRSVTRWRLFTSSCSLTQSERLFVSHEPRSPPADANREIKWAPETFHCHNWLLRSVKTRDGRCRRETILSAPTFFIPRSLSRVPLSFHFFSPRQGRRSETRSGRSVVPPPLQTLLPCSITSLPPAPHPSPLHFQLISPSICYPLSLSLRLSTALLLPWNHYGALLPWQRR